MIYLGFYKKNEALAFMHTHTYAHSPMFLHIYFRHMIPHTHTPTCSSTVSMSTRSRTLPHSHVLSHPVDLKKSDQ